MFLIVGERINSTRKAIREAISSRDGQVIRHEAQAQAQAGAHYIDVNAGAFLGEEMEHLRWLVDVVQGEVGLPLCLDSPDPEVIATVVPSCKSPPMINSITLEPDRLERVLPLAVERGCKVIGLCQSERAMATTSGQKVEMAKGLIEAARSAGLPVEDLYIDPLVMPLSSSTTSAVETLKAIEEIKRAHPGVHIICGLSNVSHGLPKRGLINGTFLIAAMAMGLDAAILDPTDSHIQLALRASLLVMGQDDYCMGYIRAYREGRLG